MNVSAQTARDGKLRALIVDWTATFQNSVQAKLDRLNAANPHPGANLF